MDLWYMYVYSHQGTTVFMLTKLPEGSKRKVSYVGSGWTTYERCSAELVKKHFLFDMQWQLVVDVGGNAKRNWPVCPKPQTTLM
mmetsp:Transcript_73019/g.219273  ORF Transcript_73019/g.219273 Transcript_73019/m.219273 type:complete len:84 (-) Transcript_73019:165-416(-)